VLLGILDQNNDGEIDAGDVTNVRGNNSNGITVQGTSMPGIDATLPSTGSVASVTTQYSSCGTGCSNYNLQLEVDEANKLPVSVTLSSGPNLLNPVDISASTSNGHVSFQYFATLPGGTPNVGDTYDFTVTYSDGSQDTGSTINGQVTAVLDALVTPISPQGSGASTTPTFTWTYPNNASSYTYQFWLCCGPNGTIWQIPSNNSNSNGFPSSTPPSITWGTDPTNPNPANPPNVSSLNGGTNYSWSIQASDANGNSAQVQVNFQTAATALSLPAAGSVGNTVAGQNWGGFINASGGVPNYTFVVNGASVPWNGPQVSLGNNLYASNTGGNTLSISGTPTSVGVVSFTVSVTDGSNPTQSAGPNTYTITVSLGSALSIQTPTLPGGNEGWAYNSYIQANGGVQPYTWSVISGLSSLNAVGLTFTSNPPNYQGNGEISGTPSAAGTPSFTVQVTDSQGTSVQQALTIAVTDCANNSKFTGNYAMLIQGWSDSSEGEVFTGLAASFVANGAGSITAGTADFNDPSDGYSQVTFTGTSCVASNNQGLMTINTGGGSRTLAFSLQSSGNGNIIWYDTSQGFQGAGVLLKQTTSAFSLSKITGPYVVGLIGIDQGGNRLALAGAFTANGTADWTNGQLDVNDNGNVNNGNGTSSPLSFSSSDVSSISSTTGRGTVGINVAGVGTFNYAFYMVNATQLLLIETDVAARTNGSLFTGQILQQSGTFNDASLNGVSVLEYQGLDTGNSPATPMAEAGFLTANGSGSFSEASDRNDGGTMSTDSGSGTYSVAANGRVTVAGTGNHSPVFYLTAKNQGFLIDTSGKVAFGTLTPQQAITFTDSSFSGNYLGGSEQPVSPNVKAQVIQVDATGASGTLTGTQDQIDNCGSGCFEPDASTLPPGVTYAPDPDGLNGKFDISQGGTIQVYLYMISTTQAAILNVGSGGCSGGSGGGDCNPGLQDFHQ
jgi:hypothetical protein